MLFKPELCQAILDGRKRQTRRLVKPYETARILTRIGREILGVWVAQYDRPPPPEIFGSTQILEQLYRRKWIVGRTYAIQPGRGKNAVGRFLLLAIRKEQLWGISELDAVAEGCIADSPGRWFPATARDKFESLWDRIHAKLGTRWEDNPEVWALEFKKAM